MNTKVVRVGTIPAGRRRASLYVKISTTGSSTGPYVSFTGVEGPLPSGNALGGCGQIDMGYAHRDPADNDARYIDPILPGDIHYAAGWDRNAWLDLLDAWKRLHMKSDAESIAEAEAYMMLLPETDKQPAWA